MPGAPEIRVHKAVPASGLHRLATEDAGFDTPYWAYHWGGGLALARYVLDHPASVAGRRVLDLGAGSGVVGIAAARSGAATVLAADVDPYAIAAVGLNAAANRVRIGVHLGDLTADPPPAVDVVLVGDLFYESGAARRVTTFLVHCLGAGVAVLVGDPGRRFLPLGRLTKVAEYQGVDFGGPSTNAVFAFR